MTLNTNSTIEQAMIEQLSLAFTKIPFNQMLGLELKKITPDSVSMGFSMKDVLVGNFLQGILHGGVISSVLDMAGGMVVMVAAIHKNNSLSHAELLEIVGRTSTIDLQVSFLRPGKGEHFIVNANLLRSGNKISFTRMDLFNQKQSLIATGSGTYACNL